VKLGKLMRSVFSVGTWAKLMTRSEGFFVYRRSIFLPTRDKSDAYRDLGEDETLPPGHNGIMFRSRFGRSRSPRQAKPAPPTLLISGLGRFGNAIQQLINAVAYAHTTGSQQILYFPSGPLTIGGGRVSDAVSLEPFSALGRNSPTGIFRIWRSDFFEAGNTARQFDQRAAKEVQKFLSKKLFADLSAATLPAGTLTIHLRSGDIFGPAPHPRYGQPPLSFYEKILSLKSWEAVRVVTEDAQNPCLEGINKLSRAMGLDCSVVGEGFDEAIFEIARSSNLVASRGTFVPGILFLSPRTRRIFEFEEPIDRLVEEPSHHFQRVVDTVGTYRRNIVDGAWENSPMQRKLMVQYPAENLAFIRE